MHLQLFMSARSTRDSWISPARCATALVRGWLEQLTPVDTETLVVSPFNHSGHVREQGAVHDRPAVGRRVVVEILATPVFARVVALLPAVVYPAVVVPQFCQTGRLAVDHAGGVYQAVHGALDQGLIDVKPVAIPECTALGVSAHRKWRVREALSRPACMLSRGGIGRRTKTASPSVVCAQCHCQGLTRQLLAAQTCTSKSSWTSRVTSSTRARCGLDGPRGSSSERAPRTSASLQRSCVDVDTGGPAPRACPRKFPNHAGCDWQM